MSEPQKIATISLWQPWASLVANHLKRYETRSWPAPEHLIGKPIAIHAAKRWTPEQRWFCTQEPFKSALAAAEIHPTQLPLGEIVAVGVLKACWQAQNAWPLTERERAFGDFSEGRYAWCITEVQRINPGIPATGKHGIWYWERPPEVPENG